MIITEQTQQQLQNVGFFCRTFFNTDLNEHPHGILLGTSMEDEGLTADPDVARRAIIEQYSGYFNEYANKHFTEARGQQGFSINAITSLNVTRHPKFPHKPIVTGRASFLAKLPITQEEYTDQFLSSLAP